MSVNHINGKLLNRKSYHILKELGIELVVYELHAIQEPNQDPWYSFSVSGGLSKECDLDELHEILELMKLAKESTSPIVKDAFEKLRLAVELSK